MYNGEKTLKIFFSETMINQKLNSSYVRLASLNIQNITNSRKKPSFWNLLLFGTFIHISFVNVTPGFRPLWETVKFCQLAVLTISSEMVDLKAMVNQSY